MSESSKNKCGDCDQSNAIGFLGCLVAAFISYKINASIVWALFHALFGWLYVIYYFVFVSGWVN